MFLAQVVESQSCFLGRVPGGASPKLRKGMAVKTAVSPIEST